MYIKIHLYIRIYIHRLCIQACLDLLVALLELWSPANDGTNPGKFDSRADMSVRVQKGGFMVDKFAHENIGITAVPKEFAT